MSRHATVLTMIQSAQPTGHMRGPESVLWRFASGLPIIGDTDLTGVSK